MRALIEIDIIIYIDAFFLQKNIVICDKYIFFIDKRDLNTYEYFEGSDHYDVI